MSDLPKTVRVGPFHYRVISDESALRKFEHDKSSMYGGYSDHGLLEICIDPSKAPDYQAETLWHELKHCVVATVGWREGALKEEEMISRTAAMELATLRDNPELVAYLLDPEGDPPAP